MKATTERIILQFIKSSRKITSISMGLISEYGNDVFNIYHTAETYARTFRKMREKGTVKPIREYEQKASNGTSFKVWEF